MEFDVNNNSVRKVMCVRNEEDGMIVSSENHHLLEVGKQYTVEDVEVYSWHTLVYLQEFPGITFNSVAFHEIEEEENSNIMYGKIVYVDWQDRTNELEIIGVYMNPDKAYKVRKQQEDELKKQGYDTDEEVCVWIEDVPIFQ